MTERKLNVGVVGGLGVMASPMALHWGKDAPVQVLRFHDRGLPGEQREQHRKAWKNHGSASVSSLSELVGDGNLDGVFVCCGKNGDDLSIIAELAELMSQGAKKQPFICHMSTVSVNFVDSAYEFCRTRNVRYVNYPLTGSAAGAKAATMLILASGDHKLYEELFPVLSLIGKPKHFGATLAAGAEVKFMGHLMVFNGLMGICSAAAVHAECLNGGRIGGQEQTAFFDFLNTGAGGTRQWDVILSNGIRDNLWSAPFSIKYAAVDAVYVAELCIDKGVSNLIVEHVINVALAFSFVHRSIGEDLATHAIVREMVSSRTAAFDDFLIEHSPIRGDKKASLERCIHALPDSLQRSTALNITKADFEKVLS